jgi:hypothetical protein
VVREQLIPSAFTQQEEFPVQSSSPLPTQKHSGMKRVSPSHDFYNDCYSFPPIIYAFFIMAIILGLYNTVFKRSLTYVYQPICLVYFYFAVLAATDLCRHTPASRMTRIMVWWCCLSLYAGVIAYNIILPDVKYILAGYSSTCVAITIFAEWKLWRANRSLNQVDEELSL